MSTQSVTQPPFRFAQHHVWRLAVEAVWLVLVVIALLNVEQIGRNTSDAYSLERNMANLTQTIIPLALMALPMVLVMASGGLDLSVGSMMALVGIVIAQAVASGASPSAALNTGLLVAAVVGVANAVLVGLLRIPGVLVTLGELVLLRGIALQITGGSPVMMNNDAALAVLPTASWTAVIVLLLVCLVLLEVTPMGRRPHPALAERERWYTRSVYLGLPYLLSALMAGLAGAMLLARLRAATPVLGSGYEAQVILAAVIGGTPLGMGFGNAIGAVLGAAIVGNINNIAVLANIEVYTQQVLQGALLVINGTAVHGYALLANALFVLWRRGRTPPAPAAPPAQEFVFPATGR